MWKKVRMNYNKGLFLMRNGMYQNAKDILYDDKDDIIGYCVGGNRIMSVNFSNLELEWKLYYNKSPNIIGGHRYYSETNKYNYMNGKYNTDFIMKICRLTDVEIQRYPAFSYCITHSPGYRDGEWYLPSMGELKLLYNILNEFEYSCNIAGLTYAGSLKLYNILWSSTEYTSRISWSINLSNANLSMYFNKSTKCYVVPFLNLK